MALKIKDAERAERVRENAAKILSLLSERAGELHHGIVSDEIVTRCREITGQVCGDAAPSYDEDYKIASALQDIEYRLYVGY